MLLKTTKQYTKLLYYYNLEILLTHSVHDGPDYIISCIHKTTPEMINSFQIQQEGIYCIIIQILHVNIYYNNYKYVPIDIRNT